MVPRTSDFTKSFLDLRQIFREVTMLSATQTQKSFFIRDLPIPAKLVVTCFLLAVGGGYTAAMVQLHMQDSKSGEMMPTMQDVVLKFTGKKWFETDPPKPVSKLEKLVMGPIEGASWNGSGSMAPAFFSKDGAGFNQEIKKDPGNKAKLMAERNGEREAVALWSNTSLEARKKSYDEDRFTVSTDKTPRSITEEFKYPDGAIHIKQILKERCERCHSKGGEQSAWPLETYEQVAKYLTVPPTVTVKPGGDWVKIEEPIGLEKLTQSTHAHLLSFAVLFSLTGLVFAFTSYPTVVRCVLGPWVLVAIVADVLLWWLARLCPEWGPYFAMGVIGTGGAAGVGLAAQITLSLWNLYGIKGRLVLGLLAVAVAAGGWAVYTNQIGPGLESKQKKLNGKVEDEKKPEEPKPGTQTSLKNEPEKKNEVAKNDPPMVPVAVSPIERVLKFPVKGPGGKDLQFQEIPFKGLLEDGTLQEGGMVRAFFDKDGLDLAKAWKNKNMKALQELTPERFSELEAVSAWIRLPDVERERSHKADLFAMPATLAGKPFTADYLAADKVNLKIRTLLGDRCVRCHMGGADAEKYPLEDYDQIRKLLVTAK